jgi:hypothetical protein
MMDKLGAIFGPLLALGLVAAAGTRWAIGQSVPRAARRRHRPCNPPPPDAAHRDRIPLRIRIRPILHGQMRPTVDRPEHSPNAPYSAFDEVAPAAEDDKRLETPE